MYSISLRESIELSVSLMEVSLWKLSIMWSIDSAEKNQNWKMSPEIAVSPASILIVSSMSTTAEEVKKSNRTFWNE